MRASLNHLSLKFTDQTLDEKCVYTYNQYLSLSDFLLLVSTQQYSHNSRHFPEPTDLQYNLLPRVLHLTPIINKDI